MTKKQLISIKGTKEGLVLRLDDQCSYSELLEELAKKVSDEGFEGQAEVLLQLGYRYCNNEQAKEIINCVQQTAHLRVTKIQSEVMTVEDCNRRLLENQSETFVGIVRSGQVISAVGDLVVIGDVNPNGRVVAGGNVFVRNSTCRIQR